MGLVGTTNEEKIWNYFKAAGLNSFGIAGLMGNLYAESGLIPTNLQNTSEQSLGYSDAEYTAAVDSGEYQNFVRDCAGYGLAQWTYWSRKENLLNYAKKAKKSIGDLEMQLDFLWEELQGYSSVLSALKTATSLREASDSVLLNFERPADQSEAVKARRATYGQTYYSKFSPTSSTVVNDNATKSVNSMTESQLRQKVVDIAVGYLGCKESDGSHKKIIDLYNSHKPLARGYAVQYTDPWCSTYASAVAIAAGLTDIIPTECGCGRHIDLFKELGSWVENDAYVPSPGDYIFYDWDDGADYATTDNMGGSDHVGIVVSCNGSTIKVIEGNKSDAVGYRNLAVNGRYIRGFGVPKYGNKSTTMMDSKSNTEASASAQIDKATTRLPSVGDVVTFIGVKHYASANAASGFACNPGKAKVTALYPSGEHPVHLVAVSGAGSSVYGWVDASDIGGSNGNGLSVGAEMSTYTVVSGDSLWAIAQNYLGNGSRYNEIMSLNGLNSTVIYPGQELRLPT